MPGALELFNDWVSSRERGEGVEFAGLVASHPELARELEDLHAIHEEMAKAGEPSAPYRSAQYRSARAEVVARPGEREVRTGFGRYEIEDEIARGGMGAILRVWDLELSRHLAMKVALGAESTLLGRFLEEAQVTGQLDHPGIVPVHELGVDSGGRLYFTMKLVQGRDLREVFDLVFDGKEGWNEARALSTLLKVCEAMAYAHDKGVIHRDLKPANVMVGKFGEVFVMDWGLARVLGEKDRHDLRIRPEPGTPGAEAESRGGSSGSPVVTMDGDVIGTPAYMPPEQARGDIEELSPRSDVYAIGAMLYHLLAREPPYRPRDARIGGRDVLARVVAGPPAGLGDLRKDIPAELEAIVEKAMARDPGDRYPDTKALAEDLRAFLEHRVVGAYETGAWAEARKWVRRNRPLAASLAGAAVLLVAGLTTSLIFKTRADEKAADLLTANTTIQQRNRELSESGALATRKANDVLSLSAIQELKELEDESDRLWPADPANLTKYERWVEKARILVEGGARGEGAGKEVHPSLADHEAKLAEIRKRAKPRTSEEAAADDERQGYDFEDAQDRWWHTQLAQLVRDLKTFTDPKSGGLYSSGISAKHGWGILRRAEFARTIEERSVSGPEARRLWEAATLAVAKSEKYGGLKLTPQLGLLPIGEDPESHLWEFAHLQTGEPARRGDDGRLEIEEPMGLVFVLVPGGTFWMGAQRNDKDEPNYDPEARDEEAPVREVALSPFFLSKYEMTQGQWERFAGQDPSYFGPSNYALSWNRGSRPWSSVYPVESVSWLECSALIQRLGLSLPTEAQWEYGCRAGTLTAYWSGAAKETLSDTANIADAYAKAHGGDVWAVLLETWDDGNTCKAAVGSYRANPFGLHDMHGNVSEWCRDFYSRYTAEAREGDGERAATGSANHICRGGGYFDNALIARAAMRQNLPADTHSDGIGVRPALALKP